MSEKKVVVFIVEGPSEEAALGSIMKEYFSNNEVQFAVIHGDITTHEYTTTTNVVSKINEHIEVLKNKYRYKDDDIIRIIHLVDTDGVFINDEYVCNSEAEFIEYFEDHMATSNVIKTTERNHKKAEVLFKLRRTGKINGISYKIYFNSCNLEHVLYDELRNFTNEEKQIFSDEFADRYEGKVDEFIEFITDGSLVAPGTYQKSWDFIEKDLNSLNRYTNMNLIFDK